MQVAGFPRSGNHFLVHSLRLMYDEEVSGPFHSAAILNRALSEVKMVVPFRNPVDCIAAWHEWHDFHLRNPHLKNNLDIDIDFYLRHANAVLRNAEKLKLVDFEKFTSDLDYLAEKVEQQPSRIVSTDLVRVAMQERGLEDSNLPNPSRYANRDAIKASVEAHPLYSEVMSVYGKIKFAESQDAKEADTLVI